MLILSNLLIFLIFQWSTDVQLSRTQSPELVHVNFGARFQVSHFITNHSLGSILWKDYCVSKCVSNREQTRKTSSFPFFPALPAPYSGVLRSKSHVGNYRWNQWNTLILTKFLIGYKFVELKGTRQEPINIYLIWGSLDRWFINKNMAEKETIVNGMQWQFLGVSVGLS